MAVVTLTGYFALSPFLGLGGEFDNDYERNDLDNNYVQNELAIIDLSKYSIEIMSDNQGFSFGFDGRNDRYYFIPRNYNENSKQVEYSDLQCDNLELHSDEMNAVLDEIGIEVYKLDSLLLKLKKANCIGLLKQPFKNKPIKIDFRYGEGLLAPKFSYLVFSEPLSDSLKNEWENKGGRKVYSDKVIFEYLYPL